MIEGLSGKGMGKCGPPPARLDTYYRPHPDSAQAQLDSMFQSLAAAQAEQRPACSCARDRLNEEIFRLQVGTIQFQVDRGWKKWTD